MEPVGPIVIFVVVVTVALAIALGRARSVNNLFKETAEKFGLSFNKGGFISGPGIAGTMEGFSVSVTHVYGSKNTAAHNVFTLSFTKSFPFNFNIAPEGFFSKVGRALGNHDLEVGDPSFDDELLLESYNEPHLIALLNRKTRGTIFNLASGCYRKNFKVNSREIEIFVEGSEITGILRIIVQLANELTRAGTKKDFFIENFKNDGNPDVRINNLRLLFQNYRTFKEKDKVLLTALEDDNTQINFIGYKNSGRKNSDNYLNQIWEKADEFLRQDIVRYLCLGKEEAHLDFLIKQFPLAMSTVKLEIIKAFEYIGNPKANDLLIKELVVTNIKTLSTVIKALGPCGKVNAVEPLMNLKKPMLKSRIKRTIAMIQSRIQEGDKGWLSLSIDNSEAGSLGFSNSEKAGNLSINKNSKE